MAEGVEIKSMREASDMMSDARVAEVYSLFNNQMNEGKVVVIVEGADDKDVYAKVMDTNTVCLYVDGNCEKHTVILTALNKHFGSRLLAIKDADFDRLEEIQPTFANLVLTDTHDLEGMIVEDCLRALEGKDAERCAGVDVTEIYAELEDISYLKWYNHVNHSGINFKDVVLDLNLTAFFSAVVANTNNVVNVTLKDVFAFKGLHLGVSQKELCNGHDIFERIYVRARMAEKSNYPKKPFFRRLREAYPSKEFTKTELFRLIKKWESANSRHVLAIA